jgi:hypothetical protein
MTAVPRQLQLVPGRHLKVSPDANSGTLSADDIGFPMMLARPPFTDRD